VIFSLKQFLNFLISHTWSFWAINNNSLSVPVALTSNGLKMLLDSFPMLETLCTTRNAFSSPYEMLEIVSDSSCGARLTHFICGDFEFDKKLHTMKYVKHHYSNGNIHEFVDICSRFSGYEMDLTFDLFDDQSYCRSILQSQQGFELFQICASSYFVNLTKLCVSLCDFKMTSPSWMADVNSTLILNCPNFVSLEISRGGVKDIPLFFLHCKKLESISFQYSTSTSIKLLLKMLLDNELPCLKAIQFGSYYSNVKYVQAFKNRFTDVDMSYKKWGSDGEYHTFVVTTEKVQDNNGSNTMKGKCIIM
jgi:hypothetical protein